MSECACCTTKCDDQAFLTCSSCDRNIHVTCLKAGCVPGGLLEDVFFDFVCSECSVLKKEEVTRRDISWATIIVLTLYNLHKRCEGTSQRGYFHWKDHICNFIEKYWNILIPNNAKKKAAWKGTVSGTLSHCCPDLFQSGNMNLKESGWWRLTNRSITPRQTMEIHKKKISQKKRKREKEKSVEIKQNSFVSQTTTNDKSNFSPSCDISSLEYNAELPEQEIETSSNNSTSDLAYWMKGDEWDLPQEGLDDALAENNQDITMSMKNTVDNELYNTSSFSNIEDFLPSITEGPSHSSLPSILPDMTHDHLPFFAMEDNPLDLPLPLFDAILKTEFDTDDIIGNEVNEESEKAIKEDYNPEKCLSKSLFQSLPKSEKVLPWEMQKKNESLHKPRYTAMSLYEESQLFNQLKRASTSKDIPAVARRLFRKLSVRRLKRERNMAVFNLDNYFLRGKGLWRKDSVWTREGLGQYRVPNPRILDRFYHVSSSFSDQSPNENCSFKYCLMGYSEPTCFISPYTNRLLKPFIFRDYETRPLWLQLLSELQENIKKRNPEWHPPELSPIDYSYVRPQHISTINSLCCEHFYPGIDLSETLQYPDFSCVVLYKKLIVGFAFMVPDVAYNETYISFLFTRVEWRRAGIASFMLYHLIQTCMGKDITLHVSATNPALMLYQKFGFKVEEFIQDFYDKYLPADSKECKHALYLRLSKLHVPKSQ